MGLALSKQCNEVGLQLQQCWLTAQTSIRDSIRSAIRGHRSEFDFALAIRQSARGEKKALVDYLRSERPIGVYHREYLAGLLEGSFDQKPKRGRPRDQSVSLAANEAKMFHRLWRRENKLRGVKDHGQSEAMRDEAVRFIANEFNLRNDSVNAIIDLMARPKRRRN